MIEPKFESELYLNTTQFKSEATNGLKAKMKLVVIKSRETVSDIDSIETTKVEFDKKANVH